MNGMETVLGRCGGSGKIVAMLLLVLPLWCVLASPVEAQFAPDGKVVHQIIVTGNSTVPTAVIQNHLAKTRIGQPFHRTRAEDDIRRIMDRIKAVRNVNVRTQDLPDGRINVFFEITEYPHRIRGVFIRNARHVNVEDLDSVKRIRRGAPLNPMLNRRAKLDIENLYHSKGYYFASVNLEQGGKTGDQHVVFNVTEGPLVRVGSVQFTGNDTLASQPRLRTQITSKKAFLSLIGGVYNPIMVNHDVRKLEEYYRSNGYLNAKITREVQFSGDFRYIHLTFHIHEGKRFRVGRVTVDGATHMANAELQGLLQVKKDQVFNGSDVEIGEKRIVSALGYRGYKSAVRTQNYVMQKPGVVHVHYQVLDRPRPPARVGEVHVIGNDVTKDRVIRRVLGLYPGQLLQYPELRMAEANLARLNIFEVNPQLGIRPTVTVIEDPLNPDSEFKDIVVQIQETHTGSFMVGLGVNSNAGLVGSIVLNERNFDIFRPPYSLNDIFEGRAFRGAGQEFRIEAVPGTELQRYTVSFREPFLFDRPYSLTLAGYYYDRIYREYTERRVGGRVSIGRQLNRQWSVVGGARLENVRVADVPVNAPLDYQNVRGDSLVIGPRIALRRDSRDSFLRPTSGNFFEASYEQVFGDFEYPIFNLEASQYFTVYKRRDGSGKHVLAARGQFSYAGDDVPVYDRFFAGGYRSMRGFEFRGVGPFQDGFNLGGNFMMLGSLEYQVPVVASDKLFLVGFVDAGTVERDFGVDDFRLSAGFGARIIVPMMGPVPIALDFGFPIRRGPGDREQIFSFYFGIGQ